MVIIRILISFFSHIYRNYSENSRSWDCRKSIKGTTAAAAAATTEDDPFQLISIVLIENWKAAKCDKAVNKQNYYLIMAPNNNNSRCTLILTLVLFATSISTLVKGEFLWIALNPRRITYLYDILIFSHQPM